MTLDTEGRAAMRRSPKLKSKDERAMQDQAGELPLPSCGQSRDNLPDKSGIARWKSLEPAVDPA